MSDNKKMQCRFLIYSEDTGKAYKVLAQENSQRACIFDFVDEKYLYHKNKTVAFRAIPNTDTFPDTIFFDLVDVNGNTAFTTDSFFLELRSGKFVLTEKFKSIPLLSSDAISDVIIRQNEKILSLLKKVDLILELNNPVSSLPKATGSFREFQNISLDLIKFFDSICRKNNIKYWIMFGTLLGAFRHKGFIPWDDDVDICILHSDLEKLQTVLKEECAKSTTVSFRNFCPDAYGLLYSKMSPIFKRRPWLDIFVFYFMSDEIDLNEHKKNFNTIKKTYINLKNVNNDLYREKVSEAMNTISVKEPSSRVFLGLQTTTGRYAVFEYDDIFPLTEVEFEGVSLFAPRNYRKLLESYYGNIYNYPVKIGSHLFRA